MQLLDADTRLTDSIWTHKRNKSVTRKMPKGYIGTMPVR